MPHSKVHGYQEKFYGGTKATFGTFKTTISGWEPITKQSLSNLWLQSLSNHIQTNGVAVLREQPHWFWTKNSLSVKYPEPDIQER